MGLPGWCDFTSMRVDGIDLLAFDQLFKNAPGGFKPEFAPVRREAGKGHTDGLFTFRA